MYSTVDDLFFTGTRVFRGVARIDLWFNDSQVAFYLEDGDSRPVLLDEEESRLIRRWAELALQATVEDNNCFLLHRRCDRLEQQRRARKLNRVKR